MSRLSRWLRGRQLLPPMARAARTAGIDLIGRHRLAPSIACEIDAAQTERTVLFERVATQWSMLGETEPHWSVLSHPRYRAEIFSAHADEFYDPRHSGAAVIETFFARNGETLSALTSCLELGCGVGRSTASLARLFPQVIAVDVSPAHLALARDHLAGAGLANVNWRQLRALDDLDALPRFELLFSEFVLQHNPPPVIAAMLERLFAKLDPGGYCLFQLPTYCDGYRFAVKDYLAGSRPPDRNDLPRNMEMHVLPQRVVYRLMRMAGIELIEVVEDNLPGQPAFQSLTFFARKGRADA